MTLVLFASAMSMQAQFVSTVMDTVMTVNGNSRDLVITERQEVGDGTLTTVRTVHTDRVELADFSTNWFVGVAAGPQIFLGENDWKMKIADMFTPTFEIQFGKWFSPQIGFDISVGLDRIKGVYDMRVKEADGTYKQYFRTNDYYGKKTGRMTDAFYQNLYNQRGKAANLNFRLYFDLMNIVAGYDENRIFSVMPYVGGGWEQGLGDDKGAGGVAFHAGVNNRFRLTDRLDINVMLRSSFIADSFDGEVTRDKSNDGKWGITIGAAYRLGKKGWKEATSEKVEYYYDKKVRELEQQAVVQQVEKKELVQEVETLKEQIVEMKAIEVLPYVVHFNLNESTVLEREKVNLAELANAIKSVPERKFSVTGYADKYTGSAKYNEELSEKRAKAVVKVLTEELGVDPSQLFMGFKGGVENMFYDKKELSRCVVIDAIK